MLSRSLRRLAGADIDGVSLFFICRAAAEVSTFTTTLICGASTNLPPCWPGAVLAVRAIKFPPRFYQNRAGNPDYRTWNLANRFHELRYKYNRYILHNCWGWSIALVSLFFHSAPAHTVGQHSRTCTQVEPKSRTDCFQGTNCPPAWRFPQLFNPLMFFFCFFFHH